jgi:bifunctional NMN adenylyltransferase/nudix hydrolase
MQEFTEKYGIAVGRFQVDHPHEGHIALLDFVNNKHKEMIIFLGVPHIKDTEVNCLSFEMRKGMLQELYPRSFILPIYDVINDDKKWSENLDKAIDFITNNTTALLYGSRNSFLNVYSGNYKTYEFPEHGNHISATKIRTKIASEVINSIDFRKGIIYARMNQRSVVHPTVDIVIYNEKGQILLGRKPYEQRFRFIGGFVDPKDENYEQAGRRELIEEAGNIEIGKLHYVCSMKVNDPRYKGLKSGIMTTLFTAQYIYGNPQASDDICELKFVDIDKIDIENDIMHVHHKLIKLFIEYYNKNIRDLISIK